MIQKYVTVVVAVAGAFTPCIQVMLKVLSNVHFFVYVLASPLPPFVCSCDVGEVSPPCQPPPPPGPVHVTLEMSDLSFAGGMTRMGN